MKFRSIFLASIATFAFSVANVADAKAAPTAIPQSTKININKIDAKTLATAIKGIGPKRAAAIVAYRSENGNFKSIDQLTAVQGISKSFITNNRERLSQRLVFGKTKKKTS